MTKALPALLIVPALVVAACGGGGKSAATTAVTTVTVNPPGTPSVTTHGRYHYPQVVVDNFMTSCTKGDTKKRAYCGCTLDDLSNHVSVRDFARIGLSGGKLTPRLGRVIRKAAIDCANKL